MRLSIFLQHFNYVEAKFLRQKRKIGAGSHDVQEKRTKYLD
jgi:hypothetical protein